MTKMLSRLNRRMVTRRDLLGSALKTIAVAGMPASLLSEMRTAVTSWRAINIVNFIRAEEPREPMDLFLPVREQMASIKAHGLPATWLLQYDAIVEGPFVGFLTKEMPADHEVGLWFEMNRKICEDAGIAWRGNPQWEWDYHVPVAYAIGYRPDERRRLADTAMTTIKRTFGRDAKSVASWNLDAITLAHFSDHHGVEAFGNCRDQSATDGFTTWGAPIAAYYPARMNGLSPALSKANQINTPVFRLLGQDPVYYYDDLLSYPDTMEPAWRSGQSEIFVDHFLEMIAKAPTQSIAYAQIGQENSFGWPVMQKAFAMQMDKLVQLRAHGGVTIETMGDSGRRFKRSFSSTPTQAQVMLQDPFELKDPAERTVWYQSNYYRANLHFRGDQFYMRDLHVYDDRFAEPYLTDVVRKHGIEQRLLAALDGYHWSDDDVRAGRSGLRAMGRFALIGTDKVVTPLLLQGLPVVTEAGSSLRARTPLRDGGELVTDFGERDISFSVMGRGAGQQLCLIFEWVAGRSAFQAISAGRLQYRFSNFDYSIGVRGEASQTAKGVQVVSDGRGKLVLNMAQVSDEG
jgi:hypothetical protein